MGLIFSNPEKQRKVNSVLGDGPYGLHPDFHESCMWPNSQLCQCAQDMIALACVRQKLGKMGISLYDLQVYGGSKGRILAKQLQVARNCVHSGHKLPQNGEEATEGFGNYNDLPANSPFMQIYGPIPGPNTSLTSNKQFEFTSGDYYLNPAFL